MKRRLWAPLIAVGLAAAILVPTTLAVGENGTTLYAQLGTNRFPSGQGAADASLQFNGERDIVLRIQILGPAGTVNAVRVYVDGTCSNPGEWVINRTANAGPDGPFLTVNSNSGVNTIQVNQLDVDRIRDELDDNPNETFALMVARVINGANYRTCTPFRTTPFPPLTTSTSTTATTPTTSSTGTNTTRFTTRTITTTVNSQTVTFTITEPVTSTLSSLTTRTSTGFSTGTSIQTLTTGFTTGTLFPTGVVTSTGTSTGFSTNFSTFTSDLTSTTLTGTSTIVTPVTTVTSTGTQTVTSTVPFTNSTVLTVTNTFSTPVTTVTLAL
jgi:hypothetical protein